MGVIVVGIKVAAFAKAKSISPANTVMGLYPTECSAKNPYYFSFCQPEPGWPALRDVTFKLHCPQERIAGLITLPILN